MFESVTITAGDHAASLRFYGLVLATLGFAPAAPGTWGEFRVMDGDDATTGLHVGFIAASREMVDEFWTAGHEAGFRDDGPPGERDYTPDYYGAFLLDPDGNSAEAVHYTGMRTRGVIDHLWVRVADVGTAREQWRSRTKIAALSVVDLADGHAIVRGPDGASMSLVEGEPTRNAAIVLRSGNI